MMPFEPLSMRICLLYSFMVFAAIRKDLVLVGGTVGTCKTEVQQGQNLQQLEPVSKHKAPRTVSLEV